MDYQLNCFKALSDKNRLRTIASLMEYGELCACQLSELLQVTGATLSRHMGILIKAELVTSRKDGRWVYYKINSSDKTDPFLDIVNNHRVSSKLFKLDISNMKKIINIDPVSLCKKQRGQNCCN